jgi:diacylglycerol kinase (ATP)
MSFSLLARLRSFRFATRGMRSMLCSQHNAWIHAVASVVVVGAGIFCGLSRIEWCVIVIAIMAVWAAEAMNTSLEFLCDVASPDFHPLIEKAKDVAAAGVLIVAIGAIVIGLLVFGPHVLRR